MRSDLYQISLITLGVVATLFFGVFFWRELFPEYRIYQKDFIELENFRKTYSSEASSTFREGVKQILIEREDKGPPTIDRCITCHVALEIPTYSPTKIAHDVNGNIQLDEEGIPIKVKNEEYIWAKLDEKIEELRDNKVNDKLASEGQQSKVDARLKQAESYSALKVAQVGDKNYDVTKVLRAHPLMGRETRPFEYHPMEEYGCTSCHSGNGRGLTTEKAHGPVFDGQYEIEFMGPIPKFTEEDPKNDPPFAHMFNDKPGPSLVFQTTPILVGSLIQSKCMECHQSSQQALLTAFNQARDITGNHEAISKAVEESLKEEEQALVSLIAIKQEIKAKGLAGTLKDLESSSKNYKLPFKEQEQFASQVKYLHQLAGTSSEVPGQKEGEAEKKVLANINQEIDRMIGSPALMAELEKQLENTQKSRLENIQDFVKANRTKTEATGTLFRKADYLNLQNDMLLHFKENEASFGKSISDQTLLKSIDTDVNRLTKGFHHGQNLFISQACYACHRIAGFARGGVGRELSNASEIEPWQLKEFIVWPQAIPGSTMPNFRLDHDQLEPLMTFLLSQKAKSRAIGETAYKSFVQEWESGKRKMPWEEPVPPSKIHDLRYSMTVFATEGCASCHRLEGFESNVGFAVEKMGHSPDFETLYREREWFRDLIPENIFGSQLAEVLEKHAKEIDSHIVDGVRINSLLEEIEKNHPGTIEGFYTNFSFANRAKNNYYEEQISKEKDPVKKAALLKELEDWKERVHRVLMVYIKEYGLGRLIGPRPNWAGVYRTDEWLMEHFRKPSAHVARSIMPAFPFDDTKFYALTYMLDILGKRNRDKVREIWNNRGFSPDLAAHIYCSQCHGELLLGNGPVSEWIYPIPKNLRNADFLRNLTKEEVLNSILNGVKGTPMPPWNQTGMDKPMADGIPVLTKAEAQRIVDWLFSSIPGGNVIKGSHDVPKWQYSPQDVIKELKEEGNKLKGEVKEEKPILSHNGLDINNLYASLKPQVSSSGTAQKEGDDIFDAYPNPPGSPDKYAYYIKKKYYTEENIEAGKAFFRLNCTVCHGSEADGGGIRAEIMRDAKPRMLTNLDWLKTKDDLYMLRSIKFGVPGTSMTPWGDLTSSLQRLQLIIFIRSLTDDSMQQNKLQQALYKAFDKPELEVEAARIKEYGTIARIEKEIEQAQARQSAILNQSQEGAAVQSKEAVEIFQKRLELMEQLKKHQAIDALLQELKKEIQNEYQLFNVTGQTFINQKLNEKDFELFLKILELNSQRFSFKEGTLLLKNDEKKEEEMKVLKDKIIQDFDQEIDQLNKQEAILKGKIATAETAKELEKINVQTQNLNKQKNNLSSGFEEAKSIRKKQIEIYEKFLSRQKNLQEEMSGDSK